MKPFSLFTLQSRATQSIVAFGLIILSGFLFSSCKRDKCLNLEPCEQYQCLNPQFYCTGITYTSGIEPINIEAAQKIVSNYVANELKKQGKIGFSSKMNDPYNWYQISFIFDDGSEYGYEVGPNGNIYEIKYKN